MAATDTRFPIRVLLTASAVAAGAYVAGSLVRLDYRFRIARIDRRLNALQNLHTRSPDSSLARQCAALEFDSLATSRAVLINRLQRLAGPASVVE